MIYLGSKNRIANKILPIILKDRTEDQYYVEPFCGGCNIIDKVTGKRIANDQHFYLIEMYKAIQRGWQPPQNITLEIYNTVKNNKEKFKPYFVGYCGFIFSFRGSWFRGFKHLTNKKENIVRNYGLESYNNFKKQIPNLLDIEFYNLNYKDLIIPDNSIIYCDPPYKNTINYKNKNNQDLEFNHYEFYDWCRNKKLNGHKVFISEYNMPSDFKVIWQQQIKNNMNYKNVTEKLFTI